MSVQAMSWAFGVSLEDLADTAARHVLLVLANFAGEDGKGAFPSKETIRQHTGLSIRTIGYKLDLLKEMGFISEGNQAIAAAYISRSDRRPVVYDLYIRKRGAMPAPREKSERGANDGTGCNSQHNGVQLKTQRGAPVAPKPSINHPLTIKDIVGQPDTAAKVIEYLNQRTGSKFKPVQSNTQLINARLKEGHSLETVIAVIDRKCAEWLNDPKMSAYLRPGTLFSAKNFNNYAGVIDKPLAPQSTQVTDDLNDTSWMNEPEGWL